MVTPLVRFGAPAFCAGAMLVFLVLYSSSCDNRTSQRVVWTAKGRFSERFLQEPSIRHGPCAYKSKIECSKFTESWAQDEPMVGRCLTEATHIFLNGNDTVCQQLVGNPTSQVMLQQSQCYTAAYFEDNKAAAYLKDMYPLQLRPGSTDMNVLMQFFCRNDFHYVRHMAPYLPRDRPAAVVDAGANIGLASLLLAQVINFNGEVFAIEANPGTYKVMVNNTRVLGDVIKPISGALVAEPNAMRGEKLVFAGKKKEFWGFRVVHGPVDKSQFVTYNVPGMSLSQIKKRTAHGIIDLIKIDIEGEEKQIFNDRASWTTLCQIRCICTEIHGWVPGANEAWQNFLANGCVKPFKKVVVTGEYQLYCKPGAAAKNPLEVLADVAAKQDAIENGRRS